ncbi:MAG: ester cyclase, partial [Hyphomonas sp.]|uniref:ester cyclase n=1 Tax=Hyphomonas sp. TaxID=87 RepID=UPI00349FE514
MTNPNLARQVVRDFVTQFDQIASDELARCATPLLGPDYLWRGMYPFGALRGAESVIDQFWIPLRAALSGLQRREDIFFAGENNAEGHIGTWTCSMGHFMGLFDSDWLGVPATGKMAFLRYAEFHRVADGRIQETALFCDLIGLMQQAGVYPLPPMTGSYFVYPGPRTHDGIIRSSPAEDETRRTLDLVNEMIADLSALNHLDNYRCPPELLARTWHDDMIWYGPCGIGASYTIPRYQEQHQYPFRLRLTDKVYHGHVARIAEGNYCGFFGWANLSNRNSG